jgi:hypothetical protein
MRWTRSLLTLGVALLGACRPAPVPVAAPEPEPPAPVRVFPAPDTVWTATPGVTLRTDSAELSIARPLTRLDVIGADSLALRVRCIYCGEKVEEGWVQRDAVISAVARHDSLATGSVAGFALAVRQGAATRDLVALWPLMSTDFAFTALAAYGRDRAQSSWVSDNFRTLDQLPGLLDAGLTPLGDWWVAPPAFARVVGYRGLRAGFRRTAEGKWEWVYLVQGERP